MVCCIQQPLQCFFVLFFWQCSVHLKFKGTLVGTSPEWGLPTYLALVQIQTRWMLWSAPENSCHAEKKSLRSQGIDVSGRFDPLAGAPYIPEGWNFFDKDTEVNATDLEWLGFRAKNRVYTTVSAEDKQLVRTAVVELKTGRRLMPMGSTNLAPLRTRGSI